MSTFLGVKAAWITDPHFNRFSTREIQEFVETLTASYDSLLISGDLSDGTPRDYVELLSESFPGPIYFVHGNHDVYGVGIELSEKLMPEKPSAKARYLTKSGVIELAPGTALIGDDGWYDGRNGVLDTSKIALRDFNLVEEVRWLPFMKARDHLLQESLQALGDRAVLRLAPKLLSAVERYKTVIVLTHVPPFTEVARWRGTENRYTQPFYTCKALGDLLDRTSRECPDTRIVVLCGHVHSANYMELGDNLQIYTGLAHRDADSSFLHVSGDVLISDSGVLTIEPQA